VSYAFPGQKNRVIRRCLLKYVLMCFILILRFNFCYYYAGFESSKLETPKTITDLTDSQIFTFVVDTQSKQKSEIIESEAYFFVSVKSDQLDYWRKDANEFSNRFVFFHFVFIS
jgi:hypothetical protein